WAMSTSTVLVLVLTTYLAFAEQNVKNATASGSYGYNQQYNEPSYDSGYNNYPSYFNGPYGPYGSYFPYGSTGPYGPYMPYGPPGPDPNVLKNNYVCSVDVAYGVYSANSRSRGRRPFVQDCSDVYHGGNSAFKMNRGYTSINCEKCCRKAAHLMGMTQNDILGMMILMNRKPKCSCCAPYGAISKILAVPVQATPLYMAPPPPPPPPPPPAASYQPPVYPTNNNQPTGY
uniref:ShKT domain-containing protein n=1 Tax=Haemonchus contortus TaxID=6289 RepID=A0A7I4YJX3_HAECO